MRNKYSEACRKIQFKIFLFTSRLSYVNRFEKKGLLFLGQNKTLSTRFKHLKNVGVKSRAMSHDYLYSLHACQRTGYTMYKKLALSKVEKLKTTIFPSGH